MRQRRKSRWYWPLSRPLCPQAQIVGRVVITGKGPPVGYVVLSDGTVFTHDGAIFHVEPDPGDPVIDRLTRESGAPQ